MSTNKKEKKRNYNQRIMQVKQGTVNLLVFSICGGMGRECRAFYIRLSELRAEKRDIHKSVMMHWIISNLCYPLLKSCLLCLQAPIREIVTSPKSNKMLQLNMNYVQ